MQHRDHCALKLRDRRETLKKTSNINMPPRLIVRDLAQHQAIRIAGSSLPLHPWDYGKKDARKHKCTDIKKKTKKLRGEES